MNTHLFKDLCPLGSSKGVAGRKEKNMVLFLLPFYPACSISPLFLLCCCVCATRMHSPQQTLTFPPHKKNEKKKNLGQIRAL